MCLSFAHPLDERKAQGEPCPSMICDIDVNVATVTVATTAATPATPGDTGRTGTGS